MKQGIGMNFRGFLILVFTFAAFTGKGQVNIVNLKCEYLTDPLGIDIQSPRFYWQLESSASAQYQSHYRIIVASNKANIDKNRGDMFDSGRKKICSKYAFGL